MTATGYETESEVFGWSFVFDLAIDPKVKQHISQVPETRARDSDKTNSKELLAEVLARVNLIHNLT